MSVPVNKDLLTGTLIIIFKKISLVTPDSYSLAKMNDRSRYSFCSPSLMSVRSSPPPKMNGKFRQNMRIWKGKGPIGRGGWNHSSTEKWNEPGPSLEGGS